MPRIVTLTMNPAVDVSTSTEQVAPIHKLRCSAGRRDPGGGGINVARVASRLGAEATAVYPVGGFVGQLLQRLLESEAVRSTIVPVHGETREDFTVLDETSGEQFRFVLPGPHLRGPEWMACLRTFAGLGIGPDFVCASGSLPPGVPDDFYARVAEIVASWGVRLALDSSGAPLKAALDQPVYLLKPSLGELRELAGAPLSDEPAMIRACHDLIEHRRVQVVALTLGAEGALLVTSGRVLRGRAAVPIKPASTVGAGDSFLGAMVWALASDLMLEDAFRYGLAAGTAALLARGTELCDVREVSRLLPQVTIQEVARPWMTAA
jgi:6-phosphofructokinase 2